MRNKGLRLLLLPALLIAACATAQDYHIAQPGYTFAFPRDYFNHEDYQTEWWYYTGNVKAADGHRFGFELTFFRQGVSRAENSRRRRAAQMFARAAGFDRHRSAFFCEDHRARTKAASAAAAGTAARSAARRRGDHRALR